MELVIALAEPEGPVVWAALVAPEDPVAPEKPVVPVALEFAPAEVREPENVPVERVPERDPVAGPPLRTKSVIAPHRRGLVPVPKRVEDMAVVAAETTPVRAAKEAARVWVAAE